MPASIFAGSKVKTLKDTLSLNGGAEHISTAVDPTAAGLTAPIGSIASNTSTGTQYVKTGSGDTNWTNVLTGSTSSPYQWSVVSVSSNTVLTAASYPNTYDLIILASASAGSITITLPAANTVQYRKFTIKRTDSNTTTNTLFIATTSGLIDAQISTSISKMFLSYTVISDGSNYHII